MLTATCYSCMQVLVLLPIFSKIQIAHSEGVVIAKILISQVSEIISIQALSTISNSLIIPIIPTI